MVEFHDDSRGKSALISGAEARVWKQMSQARGLIDAYLCSMDRKGGVYTRQAFCGLRLDSARLDRLYISEGADWVNLVEEVTHNSDQVVSDHIPVTIRCRLTSMDGTNWKPKSYFKMGDVLRREKKAMQEEQREMYDLRLEVSSIRKMLEEEEDPDILDLLKKAEGKLRILEQEEARIWRRGVRQGCPLAPYLFTFCTQVMMDMLRNAGIQGRLRGLNIKPDHCLLHQLFVDDTGIFLQANEQVFNNTRQVISSFEKASGARLNLQKSTVIPLSEHPVPTWLLQSGCQIATRQDRFRYLGVLTGIDVLDDEITQDIKLKYDRRLSHWTNKLLTWPEKTILCRNVLGTFPYFTLMTVGLCKKGLKMLQKVTRDFLWGENSNGRKKKPLLA
ncbi:hypothetical protein R1sor_025772 [Riccia sorocarpa]|uniref:Reverse transcriptase domain-containing protein n=1 Tax=Riccia sorocarpa TaxID=122646 RepID=A0ABD3GBL5_9MARC